METTALILQIYLYEKQNGIKFHYLCFEIEGVKVLFKADKVQSNYGIRPLGVARHSQ